MSIDFSPEFSPLALRLERASVLRFATRLTKDATDPQAVLTNATVIQSWLLAAPTRDDRRDRLQALERAHTNNESSRKPDDDPGRLIREAEAYYAFIKGA